MKYIRSKESVAAANKAWKDRNPEWVKQLRREANYRANFGLKPKDVENLLILQNNLCAICNKPEIALGKDGKTPRLLSIDHCHTTGKIRGMLCHSCNRLIGYGKDNPAIIKNAATYLEIADTGLVVRKPTKDEHLPKGPREGWYKSAKSSIVSANDLLSELESI